MPLHIYEGLSGKLITTILKPGRRNKQSDVASLLKKIIGHIREEWSNTMIIVRGDGHFASEDFSEYIVRLNKFDMQYKAGEVTQTSANVTIKDIKFDAVNFFIYSSKENTIAEKFEPKISFNEKYKRLNYAKTELKKYGYSPAKENILNLGKPKNELILIRSHIIQSEGEQ